jgi:MSHA pilin protein MshD
MSSSRERGLSLIEVVVFIVVLGIGLAGMAVLYNQLTKASVDPMVRKQAVAIANSLMEEIQLQPFTFCDPDDPAVFTAPTPPCAIPEVIGVEGAETRYGNTGPSFLRYDNVSDYAAFPTMSGSIQDINNNTIAGLAGYSASVAVAEASADFATPGGVPLNEALRITVTVTGPVPTNVTVVLQGYRLRYAPNSP